METLGSNIGSDKTYRCYKVAQQNAPNITMHGMESVQRGYGVMFSRFSQSLHENKGILDHTEP